MSMILCLYRLPESEAAGYRADPETIDLEAIDQADQSRFVDLDKSWHAIHFLLTGTALEGDHPASTLLLGGEPLGDVDLGYGPGRLLPPSEVVAFADVLRNTTEADLRSRLDPNRMQELELYPQIWDEEPDELLEYIGDYFESLRDLFEAAAGEAEAVLIWMG